MITHLSSTKDVIRNVKIKGRVRALCVGEELLEMEGGSLAGVSKEVKMAMVQSGQ